MPKCFRKKLYGEGTDRMDIKYTDERYFTQQQVQKLFQSVNWISANYPSRLIKALNNCETVFTAWDNDQLVGLINTIDDGELTAYVHYLCVRQDYQKKGIGKKLLELVKNKYKDYFYLMLVAENDSLITYYKNLGFEMVTGTHVMAIQNK